MNLSELTVFKVSAGVNAVIDGSLGRSPNEALLGTCKMEHMSTETRPRSDYHPFTGRTLSVTLPTVRSIRSSVLVSRLLRLAGNTDFSRHQT